MMYCAGLGAQEFRALPLTVRIHLAASEVLGWRYPADPSRVRFPKARRSIPIHLVDGGGDAIDCSSLTAYILATVYPDALWTEGTYKRLQIIPVEGVVDPWSPLRAVEAAGVGGEALNGPRPGSWYLSQGWHSLDPLRGGHARLFMADSENPDNLLILESSSRNGNVGPRWTTNSWSWVSDYYDAGVRIAALGPY